MLRGSPATGVFMRRGLIAALLKLAGILLVGAVLLVGFAWVWNYTHPSEIAKNIKKLNDPAIYHRVGPEVALLCQSLGHEEWYGVGDDAWIPELLQSLHPASVWLMEDYGVVELGGGFYHYGYTLAINQDASSDAQNVWEMHLHNDEFEGAHLMTITLPADARLPDDEFARISSLYHANRVSRHPARPR